MFSNQIESLLMFFHCRFKMAWNLAASTGKVVFLPLSRGEHVVALLLFSYKRLCTVAFGIRGWLSFSCLNFVEFMWIPIRWIRNKILRESNFCGIGWTQDILLMNPILLPLFEQYWTCWITLWTCFTNLTSLSRVSGPGNQTWNPPALVPQASDMGTLDPHWPCTHPC